MKKILLVDGHSLLFQSFYGMPRKILNSKGENIEAVVCFMGILNKTIKLLTPDFVCVIFDGENFLKRQEIDIDYKANRNCDFSNVADEDNPFLQLDKIREVLNFKNIYNFETSNCEADDFIASLANNFKEKFEIVIFSQDKDFYQLIEKNVKVFHYRGKISKLYGEKEFFDKFGFKSCFFSTFLALMGDKSDNIQGLSHIGCKTATSLICQFGDYKNILNNLNSIKVTKIQNVLTDEKDKLLRNINLVSLIDIKNYEVCIDKLQYNHDDMKTMDILKFLKFF